MPEGPEIRKAADIVAKAILGKTVLKVEFGLPHLKHWEPKLLNVRVKAVETHGKAMVTRFDADLEEGLNIFSHNQLYGRWVCCPANQVPPSTRQLRMGYYSADQWALLYSASDIHVLSDIELQEHPFIKKLGKDVLEPETTVAYVTNKLLSPPFKNRQIGSFLTEQSFVAGLGNYLRCDILFATGIHPTRKPSSLSNEKIIQLAKAILELPRQSYRTESVTNDLSLVKELLAKDISLENARFQVFRRDGLPCYRCGGIIIKKKTGSQPCYICENCQS